MLNNVPDYISGYLNRQNFLRIWTRRYAVIKETTLIFYKDDSRQTLEVTYDIPSDVMIDIEDDAKSVHKFTIYLNPQKSQKVTCSTENSDNLMRWVLALRGCTFNSRRVSMDDFKIISVIGRGFYGKVMLCENIHNGKMLAIKTIQKWKLVKSNSVKSALIERNILELCDFPFIVKLQFAFQTEKKFYIGIEYVPGGELFHYLSTNGDLPLFQIKLYVAEIALALDYMHNHNILYRDLKPENILIAADGHIKITDFGNSKICNRTATFCGTPEYIAPEMLSKNPYGIQADWWALGCLTYELLYGFAPFSNKNSKTMFENILYKAPIFPDDAQADIVEFITMLLNKDPKKRWGFQQVKGSKFLSELDFNMVLKKQIKPLIVPNVRNAFNPGNFDEEFVQENPLDSYTGQEVDQENQYFVGFSFNNEPSLYNEKEHINEDNNMDKDNHNKQFTHISPNMRNNLENKILENEEEEESQLFLERSINDENAFLMDQEPGSINHDNNIEDAFSIDLF